jgi:sodium-dependent phosphate cotransporter
LEIALVHLLFNILGTVIIYPVETIRRVPLAMAEGLTRVAVRSRKTTVVAVAAFFYGVPALILFVARVL